MPKGNSCIDSIVCCVGTRQALEGGSIWYSPLLWAFAVTGLYPLNRIYISSFLFSSANSL